MTGSGIFYVSLLALISGIFFASFFNIPNLITFEFLFLGVFYTLFFFKQKNILIFGIFLLSFFFGLWRFQLSELNFQNHSLKPYITKRVTIIGKIVQEPDIRDYYQNLEVRVEKIGADKKIGSFFGKVLIKSPLGHHYYYGEKIEAQGILTSPGEFPDFNYKDYLKKQRVAVLMNFPKIKPLSSNRENSFHSVIFGFKKRLQATIEQNLSPPQSSILAAVVLGDKSKINSSWKKKLNVVGIRHLTAISGMHIVILSAILLELGIIFGLWRGKAFYFALIFVWFYIMMIGFQPSAVRAGIMGSLLLFCQKIGRGKSIGRILVLACALMVIFDPFLLKYSVGFQLSFLAVLGIAYLGQFFYNFFQRIKFIKTLKLAGILSVTFAAQVFTLPLLIYNFGYLSLIGPLANILIVPLLPYIMASGFLFLLAGLIYQPLGWLLSLPVYLLLHFLSVVVDILSRFPFASLNLKIHWLWLPIFYTALGYFLWRLEKRKREFIGS